MGFADRLRKLFRSDSADDQIFEELSDLLVEGDLGPSLAFSVADELKQLCAREKLRSPEQIKGGLKRILSAYGKEISLVPSPGKLNVFLMLGVNGVGKTTSCAKLADYFRREKLASSILLAAGDTYRAAAIDQLKIHGERLGIRVVAQAPGADPAAVLWDAVDAAAASGADLVLADTAGRMHTRSDLVKELGKIDKIMTNRAAGANYRRLLVLDSTTGQNGLRQAEIFSEAVKIDGVVLTKHDSSAKGGMAIRLAKELNLPTAYIGTGEGYSSIQPFSLSAFLDEFLGIEA